MSFSVSFCFKKQELLYIIRAGSELTAGSKFLGVALLMYFPLVASSRVPKRSRATSGQGEELTLPCCGTLPGPGSTIGEGWV